MQGSRLGKVVDREDVLKHWAIVEMEEYNKCMHVKYECTQILSRGGDHEIVKEVGVDSSSLMCLGLPGLISSVLAVLGK